MQKRWWANKAATQACLTAVSEGDGYHGVGAAWLGLHNTGRMILTSLSHDTCVDYTQIRDSLKHASITPAIEAASRAMGSDRKTAAKWLEKQKAIADKAAAVAVKSMVSAKVPWPNALSRAASIYGLDSAAALSFSGTVRQPSLPVNVANDLGDRALLSYVANKAIPCSPLSREISKSSDYVTQIHDGKMRRVKVERDSRGRFSDQSGSKASESTVEDPEKARAMEAEGKRERDRDIDEGLKETFVGDQRDVVAERRKLRDIRRKRRAGRNRRKKVSSAKKVESMNVAAKKFGVATEASKASAAAKAASKAVSTDKTKDSSKDKTKAGSAAKRGAQSKEARSKTRSRIQSRFAARKKKRIKDLAKDGGGTGNLARTILLEDLGVTSGHGTPDMYTKVLSPYMWDDSDTITININADLMKEIEVVLESRTNESHNQGVPADKFVSLESLDSAAVALGESFGIAVSPADSSNWAMESEIRSLTSNGGSPNNPLSISVDDVHESHESHGTVHEMGSLVDMGDIANILLKRNEVQDEMRDFADFYVDSGLNNFELRGDADGSVREALFTEWAKVYVSLAMGDKKALRKASDTAEVLNASMPDVSEGLIQDYLDSTEIMIGDYESTDREVVDQIEDMKEAFKRETGLNFEDATLTELYHHQGSVSGFGEFEDTAYDSRLLDLYAQNHYDAESIIDNLSEGMVGTLQERASYVTKLADERDYLKSEEATKTLQVLKASPDFMTAVRMAKEGQFADIFEAYDG